jgi:hypothetical protein
MSAGIYAVVVGGGLLAFGYLLVDTFLRDKADMVTRLGLSLAGVCAFSLALMVAHMATGGAVFSNPWLVRGPTAAAVIALSIRKIGRREANGSWWLWLGVALLAATIVWGTPVFRMLPLTSTADTQLHNGWIRQLMNGETTPGAVITGDVPNYYPWLFHALGGLTTYLTPGRNPYYALGPLQLMITTGALLAWFALGRSLVGNRIGGAAGAVFGALAGGVGFVLLRGLDVVINPRSEEGEAALRYAGDLLFTRSYNIAFHNIAPPFPRDLAFALMAVFVLLLAQAIKQPTTQRFVLAGTCLGLVGLTGGETFIASLVVVALVIVLPWGLSRLLVAAALAIPALALYALWAVPIAVNYARLGGFVTITHIVPIDLPAYAVAVAWGVTLPFALYGGLVVARSWRADRSARFVAVLMLGLIAALAIATLIPLLFGEGFDTLGRRHRYWPLTYLGVAAVAVFGATKLAAKIRSRFVIAMTCAAVGALALASPVAASIALPVRAGTEAVLSEALEREPGSVLNAVDRAPGHSCVVAAPQEIAREVFSYTGYRLVLWTGTWFGTNRARIRWADIYDHIATDERRIRDNRRLVNGWGDPAEWREIAASYDVDVVVAPVDHARYQPFRGIPRRTADDYIVLTLDRCGA